jgi:hypothetical protein
MINPRIYIKIILLYNTFVPTTNPGQLWMLLLQCLTDLLQETSEVHKTGAIFFNCIHDWTKTLSCFN